jgi:hypothetical protein
VAVELARLSRQVTRLPGEVVRRHWVEGAVGAWRLDRLGWADLPGSCYTYRDATAALLAETPVSVAATPVLYDPPPGRSVFHRTKVATLERRGPRLALSQSMFDEVHAFQVWLAVEPGPAGGPVIVDAGSMTPRLPYGDLCSVPQGRIETLRGEPVDAGLRRRLGALVGGPEGCAQLFDLTADLLKLLLY